MSETLRDLVVSLSLNSDNFTRNIKSVNKQIQQAESEFKLAAAGIEGFEKSATGLAARLGTLKQKLDLQKVAVDQYEKALTQANNKLTECKNRQQDYAQRLEDAKRKQSNLREEVQRAQSAYEGYRKTLGEGNSATIAAKQNLDALKDEYKQSSDEVKKLEGQQTALQKSTQNASDAVRTATTNLNNAKAAVKQTRKEIDDCNKSLTTAQSAWTKAGLAAESFGKKQVESGKNLSKAGKTLTATVSAPIVALGTAAVKASIDFEEFFTGVRKTVDATEEEYASLADASKRMSTQIATSTDEINEVMATGGQLGIANAYLVDFTRTMIDLGNSCEDLNANEAAAQLAKFANIMGTDQSKFQNMGSAIVDLGNNFATTEAAIVDMAMRLGGAGKMVGLTEAQVLGFATALSSVGINAEMGGSAFSKALIKMEVAAATGGEALEDFGKVSGMTGEAFKALWDSDPAAAFQAFIVGLAQMDEEGESAIAVLDEIGIKEVRLRDTLLRSVNATELFSNAQTTATRAWRENTALTNEAGKRYGTTASKLKNLKNTAMLFGQQIGDDLNPTIQNLIDGANDLLEKFQGLDESQRMSIIKFAAFAAAAGPVLTVFGKMKTGVGTAAVSLGKFMTSVGKAGGGVKGLFSVLSKSPAAWFAVTAAVVAGTVALVDYVSGAKQAREALKAMQKTADDWKNTAAETFYGNSEGLSFFGLSKEDFSRETRSAQEWLDGLLAVWTDGQKETDDVVSDWTESFKELTASTREELASLKLTADQAGYTSVSEGLKEDIATLNALDAEIESLLKKRQSKEFSRKDKLRLQALIDAREEIEVKYHLSPADEGGFDTIRQKLEAEVARAQARGQTDADVSVYQAAIVASAEGMAAVNAEIDAQYDKEFALIQLISDAAERQTALDELNAKYNYNRYTAAQEYAKTLSGVVMPVWEQEGIQQAATDVATLSQKLREYSTLDSEGQKGMLSELAALADSMDESSLVEYVSLLTQIQSLMDSGMSEAEVQAMFPDVDFSKALEQIASIQAFLNSHKTALPGLQEMFGEALPEEVLKIATDLDMTGAQERWNEFAQNPGAITTEAIISGIQENKNTVRPQLQVDAFIAKYTEVPEGADKAALTPAGLVAYVEKYAESTTGTDVSGLTPENVTAMVAAYKELAAGADVSTLKPDEITAHISNYLEENNVDTTGLTPGGITAFVMAYEEVTGGARTTALTPDDVTAMVTKYLEAKNVDISELSNAQIEAMVTRFAEATVCDKSQLLQNFTAYITKYDDTNATKPTLSMTVGIYGYDLMAYRKFIAENPVEVKGIVKLGEVYENPSDALLDPQATFWQDGQEIPVEAVPTELLTPDKVAVLDEDGTLHVLIAPEVTGAAEAVAELRHEITENDSRTTLGIASGLLPDDTMSRVKSAVDRINSYTHSLDYNGWERFWASLRGESVDKGILNESMSLDFNPERTAALSAYVGEVVAAIQQGKQVSEEDVTNLQEILTLLQGLDTTETGAHIREGVAAGMTEAGWDADAESVASDLEAALNAALQIHSPSQRVKPVGENVSAGVGEGMSGYSFDGDAEAMASAVQAAVESAFPENMFASLGTSAAQGLAKAMTSYPMAGAASSIAASARSSLSSNLNSGSLRSIGVNAMAGLKAGINAGRSGVISAMRSAARAAVNAAKSELKIHSPSRVFEDEVGVMAMRGWGKGVLKETQAQAKVIRNASRYLTGEAKDGSISTTSNDNRRTYNNSVNSTIQVQQMVVRDEQDIRALAVEIASLTRRQQRGKGLRFA